MEKMQQVPGTPAPVVSTPCTPNINNGLITEVVPRLWLGQLGSIKEAAKIRPCSSWTVISILQSEKLIKFAKMLISELQVVNPSFPASHKVWELADKRQAALVCDQLDDILTTIDQVMDSSNEECDGQVLVHCAHGVSRSVAVVAAWLISRHNQSLAGALDVIRSVRPAASPNLGFLASLRALEQCEGNVSAAMERLQNKLP